MNLEDDNLSCIKERMDRVRSEKAFANISDVESSLIIVVIMGSILYDGLKPLKKTRGKGGD
jgi:hypothetical protein